MSGEPVRRPAIPSRVWLRLDALLPRNPKVGRLTDAQFRAFVITLCEAKLAQSEGEWPSDDHWRYAVGPKAARHLEALVAAGILDRVDGWIRVHDWEDWQPKDATSAERSKRYRDRLRAERRVTRDAPWRHTERGETKNRSDLDGVAASGQEAAAPLVETCPRCDRVIEDGDPIEVRADAQGNPVRFHAVDLLSRTCVTRRAA